MAEPPDRCVDEGTAPASGLAESGIEDNGIQINGIQINGIQINGIQINGIQINGIQINGIQINGLRLDGEPLGTREPAFAKLYRYLVECALPAGETATLQRADGTASTVAGSLGLAPEWRDGPLSCAGERRVSACLAARSNALAQPVTISLRGAGLDTTDVERDLYTTYEGAFWANLFDGEPYIHACLAEGGGLSGRVCAAGDACGFRHMGDCADVCGARDPIGGHYIECGGETAVISTFLNLGARITFGQDNACTATATDDGGGLYCFGKNDYGQLGDGTTENRGQMTPVLGMSADVVEAGIRDHACARKRDGTLWCWGRNDAGQLGDGSTAARHEPVHVAALGADVASFGIGAVDTCAVRTDGSAWCWGRSLDAAGAPYAQTVPAPMPGLDRGVARLSVSTLARHFCAVTGDGALWCWGKNDFGQLGDGTAQDHIADPVQVATDDQGAPFGGVTDACASDTHTCARKSDGSAWCWGDDYPRPHRMALDLAVAPGGLACGRDHACFVTIDSGVWCLGDNRYDQLGFDTGGAYTLIPGRVPGIDAVSTLNAGDRHTCATRSDGSLWCWGTNAFLGLSMTPTQVDIALP